MRATIAALCLAACTQAPAVSANHALGDGDACDTDSDCSNFQTCQAGNCQAPAQTCAEAGGTCGDSNPDDCTGVATESGFSDCATGLCCFQVGTAACAQTAAGAQCVTSGACSTGYVLDPVCGDGQDCCAPPDADTCADGECLTCAVGQVNCADTCVDITSDLNNCGGCGDTCQSGNSSTCCAGSCADVSSDPNNCGGCGAACQSGNTPGCCAGGCTDFSSDPNNCGTCGTTCQSGTSPACCGNGCTDLSDDPYNCGACGTTCDGQSCTGGQCD